MQYLWRINSHSVFTPRISTSIDYLQYIIHSKLSQLEHFFFFDSEVSDEGEIRMVRTYFKIDQFAPESFLVCLTDKTSQ